MVLEREKVDLYDVHVYEINKEGDERELSRSISGIT